MDTEVIKYVQVPNWMDCIVTCLLHENISCTSVNFRKTGCGEKENCELLKAMDTEQSLQTNKNFNHYKLLNKKEVSTRKSWKLGIFRS